MKHMSILAIILMLFVSFAQAKGFSGGSKSYSFSSSKSFSAPSKSFSISSTPKSSSLSGYNSRRSEALVNKGSESAKFYSYKSMEKDMTQANIKKKESVIATEKALHAPSYNYKPTTIATPSVTNKSSTYSQSTPTVIEHHYHNSGPGLGTIIAGNMIGNALSGHSHSSNRQSDNNVSYNSSMSNRGQQSCTNFDNNCMTSPYHFINSIDF